MAEPTTTALGPSPDAALTAEQRFAVVPEWVLDLEISDAAFRLYAVLARYGNSSGVRMPGRALLARRMRKSVDTVDRALRELAGAGVLEIERRAEAGRNLTNRYHLRTVDPAGEVRTDAATPAPSVPLAVSFGGVGGRTDAATPASQHPRPSSGGRRDAATGGRMAAARVAAPVRPDPDPSTETTPPTPAGALEEPAKVNRRMREDPNQMLLAACGIEDLDRYAAEVQRLRTGIGQPSVRWAGPCLLAALQLAVKVRSWPAHAARQALLLVAADPRTRSPMRLAEAGPWWDHAAKQILQRTPQEQAELDGLERLLADCDDRALLQQQARRQLAADGQPVTRLTVARRAARLLENQTRQAEPPPAAVPRARNTTGTRVSA